MFAVKAIRTVSSKQNGNCYVNRLFMTGWNYILQRKNKDTKHLVVINETHAGHDFLTR